MSGGDGIKLGHQDIVLDEALGIRLR